MKIALMNGSPKTSKNNSQYFADELEGLLSSAEIVHIRINRSHINEQDRESLAGCDALVLCFPLYADAIPSHLLAVLVELETFFREKQTKPDVYSIVNCGFYEGGQTHIAFDVLRNWALRAGLCWHQGVGIGGGEMLGQLDSVPIGKGPKTSLGKAMSALAANILRGDGGENLFVNPNFPRFAFLWAGSIGWKRQAKANGISPKEIYRKPFYKGEDKA